jgi:hypothetical protein
MEQGGKTLKLRYRLVLHRGNAHQGNVALRHTEYRAKVTVEVGAAQPSAKKWRLSWALPRP